MRRSTSCQHFSVNCPGICNEHFDVQKAMFLSASQDLMIDLNGVAASATSTAMDSTMMSSKHVSSQPNLSRLEMLYARQVAFLNEKHVQQGSVPNAVLLFKVSHCPFVHLTDILLMYKSFVAGSWSAVGRRFDERAVGACECHRGTPV